MKSSKDLYHYILFIFEDARPKLIIINVRMKNYDILKLSNS
jgi:hypothetical protein